MSKDFSVFAAIVVICIAMWWGDDFVGLGSLSAFVFFILFLSAIFYIIWRMLFTSGVAFLQTKKSTKGLKEDIPVGKQSSEQGTSTVVVGE